MMVVVVVVVVIESARDPRIIQVGAIRSSGDKDHFNVLWGRNHQIWETERKSSRSAAAQERRLPAIRRNMAEVQVVVASPEEHTIMLPIENSS